MCLSNGGKRQKNDAGRDNAFHAKSSRVVAGREASRCR
jgi:hypothetical protein